MRPTTDESEQDARQEKMSMAEPQARRTRRLPVVTLIRRAIGRPYLFMAAAVLIVGAIWFIRLAVQEFLLLDRLINVYTNEAQIKMDTIGIKPGITAEVVEVSVAAGDSVQKGQVLIRLAQDDILAELRKAEAAAESIEQQVQESRLELPLVLERAQGEVARARALLETRQRAYHRAQELLTVERDRLEKTLREQEASLEGARARLREQETSFREAEMTLQRIHSLSTDGIVAQDRLDAARLAMERARARFQEAHEQVRQVQERYPSRDSAPMTRVHEKEAQRQLAEVKEQQAAVDLANTSLRLAAAGEQRLKVLEARHKEAQAQAELQRLRLAKTVLRSPIDGIVGYRNVEPGEIVRADPPTPLLLIHDPRSCWIEAQVWESDIRRVAVGQHVEIWIDAFKTASLGRGKPFQGRVLRINPTTFSEVAGLPPERFFTRRERKIPVKIALEQAEPDLRAGLLAEVLILVDNGAAARELRHK